MINVPTYGLTVLSLYGVTAVDTEQVLGYLLRP